MKPRTGSWLGSVVPSSCGDLPSAHHRDFFLLNGTRCLDRVWFSIIMFCFILGFICISDKVKKGHLLGAFSVSSTKFTLNQSMRSSGPFGR